LLAHTGSCRMGACFVPYAAFSALTVGGGPGSVCLYRLTEQQALC
jgi:hypothetical protein